MTGFSLNLVRAPTTTMKTRITPTAPETDLIFTFYKIINYIFFMNCLPRTTAVTPPTTLSTAPSSMEKLGKNNTQRRSVIYIY